MLIGGGAYKKRVEEIIAEKNIGNVTLLPFQPYEDISHVFSLGDVGLVISKPGVGENSVPSKTWSILSASRPVLANFDENELKDIVAENQCGIFTKAGDKAAFTEAILKLYDNRELCEEYGKNGREFIMKDAYSFDTTQEGLEKEYENMAQAYTRIFKRCGLNTKMVQSDSGAIGGSVSHEFMVITDTDAGENDVFYCDKCGYSANSNHAVSVLPEAKVVGDFEKAEIIDTPNTKTIEELAEFLKIVPTIILKTLVYIADGKPVMALIRGDRQVEETKLMNAVGANDIRIASSAEIEEIMQLNGKNACAGFISPIGIKDVRVIADLTTKEMKNFVVGCNETDKHFVGANWVDVLENPELIEKELIESGRKD